MNRSRKLFIWHLVTQRHSCGSWSLTELLQGDAKKRKSGVWAGLDPPGQAPPAPSCPSVFCTLCASSLLTCDSFEPSFSRRHAMFSSTQRAKIIPKHQLHGILDWPPAMVSGPGRPVAAVPSSPVTMTFAGVAGETPEEQWAEAHYQGENPVLHKL